jgi:hypothetical protein
VRESIQIYARGYGGSSQQYAGIGFAMSEHTNGYWGSGILSRDDTGSYGAALAFYTSTGAASATPTEKMRIDSNGNVGIGTTSPDTILNIQGVDPTFLIQDSDEAGDGFIKFQTANGTQRAFIQAAMTSNVMLLGVGTSEAMRIDSGGNIQLSIAGTKILNSSGKPILQQTGSVLQVVSATLNTYGSTGSTTYVAVTGLSVAITPASTTNKVLIRGYIWLAGSSQNGLFATVYKNGAILSGVAGSSAQPNAVQNGGSGTVIASGGFIPASGYVTYQATPIYFEFLDSPASTSSVTYQIYVRVGGGGTLYYNYQSNTGTNSDFGYFASSITAEEIVA